MASLVSSLHPKDGFHTTSTTQISITQLSALQNCSLHLYYTLPPLIFVDPYELVHHQHSYDFKHWGTSNLELPVTAVNLEGSALLLDVSFPDDASVDVVEVRVPLHMRYGEPAQSTRSGHQTAEISWPVGFLACPSASSQQLSASEPLPRMPDEFSSSFDPNTSIFIPIPADGKETTEVIHVPVGSAADLAQVELGTAIIILLAFTYLLRMSYKTARRINFGSVHHKTE